MTEEEKAREQLAGWMIGNGFATGHGDTIADLLKELTWQIKELRDKIRKQDLSDATYEYRREWARRYL